MPALPAKASQEYLIITEQGIVQEIAGGYVSCAWNLWRGQAVVYAKARAALVVMFGGQEQQGQLGLAKSFDAFLGSIIDAPFSEYLQKLMTSLWQVRPDDRWVVRHDHGGLRLNCLGCEQTFFDIFQKNRF